jgi:hypothetical protein
MIFFFISNYLIKVVHCSYFLVQYRKIVEKVMRKEKQEKAKSLKAAQHEMVEK